jgi:hypothetical protein
MHAATHASTGAASISTALRWAGGIISALAVLFLLVDGVIKTLQLAPAVEASALLGYPERLTLGIGLLELACLAVYVTPRASVLGAIVLTGYLGGAVATHVRVGSEPFSVVFPIVVGGLLWGGLALRDARLRALMRMRP